MTPAAMNDYKPNDTIMRRDNDEMHALKHAVFDILTETERHVLIAYSEAMSYTKLARALGVGRMTAVDEIHRIREKIKDYMNTKGFNYDE